MSTLRRIMGIDHGEVRIGVALSDPFGLFASPSRIVPAQPQDEALAALKAMVREEQVTKIVIGLPTNSEGKVGFQAKIVLAWARELAKVTPVPIILWDESYSSAHADDIQPRRKRRSEPVDDIAAAAILQDYLDSGGTDHEPGQALETFPETP